MRVLVAPDKFKGTLTASEVAAAICKGLASRGVDSTPLPLADGGDGSVDAALSAGVDPAFRAISTRVCGADGQSQVAVFAYDGHTAVVEVANTCGLGTLPAGVSHPMTASSLGFGQAVRAAIEAGARRVVLALGGSASTDGGTGMLTALGVRFLDEAGRDARAGGAGLQTITTVDTGGLIDLSAVDLVVATDVDHPLLGPDGAAAVFAPQKGARPEEVDILADGLAHLARAMGDPHRRPGSGISSLAGAPGAGAAGGLGFACRWLGARRVSGAEFFLDLVNFATHVETHDAIITGEGRLDRQSLAGKLPSVVASRACGRPVHFVVGSTTLSDVDGAVLGAASINAIVDHTHRDPARDPALSASIICQISGDLASRLA
jgi:glycerate kinase